jgi:hypothetical protein
VNGGQVTYAGYVSVTATESGAFVSDPQEPVPSPRPTPTPFVPEIDLCSSGETWNMRRGDFRELASKIGWKIADDGTPTDVRGLSFTEIKKRLTDNGFSEFINLNFIDHPGGFDFEGKINNRWYHVTIYPGTKRQSRTNPRRVPKAGLPLRKFEIHCEEFYKRPQTHLFN